MPRVKQAEELKTKEIKPNMFYKNKVINKRYIIKIELSLVT